jgi:O-glycosyl hydrolase
VVESSEKLHESLQGKPSLQFGSSRASAPTISVGDSQFQQIDGFGASLTDSSAWLLGKKTYGAASSWKCFSIPGRESG